MASENEQENEKRETLADIVAEMRQRIAVKMSDAWYTQAEWRNLCDRIEAAWKRDEERAVEHATRHAEAVARDNCRDCVHNPKGKNYEGGNAAAMRDALQKCVVELEPYCDGGCRRDDVLEEAKAALSAPPRQCDVGTAEEQVRRHCSMCVTITKNGTKGCDYSKCNSCFAKWSQMPYEAEEGDAK